MDIQNETKYEMIDTKSLSQCLAENDFIEQTNGVTDEHLYDWHVVSGETDGVMRKEYKPHWASIFHTLHSKYVRLIAEFQKPKKDVPYPATVENTREKCLSCGTELWYAHEVKTGLCPLCSNKLNH
jgi:hypothetical protein